VSRNYRDPNAKHREAWTGRVDVLTTTAKYQHILPEYMCLRGVVLQCPTRFVILGYFKSSHGFDRKVAAANSNKAQSWVFTSLYYSVDSPPIPTIVALDSMIRKMSH
jgi:hypothetical protein